MPPPSYHARATAKYRYDATTDPRLLRFSRWSWRCLPRCEESRLRYPLAVETAGWVGAFSGPQASWETRAPLMALDPMTWRETGPRRACSSAHSLFSGHVVTPDDPRAKGRADRRGGRRCRWGVLCVCAVRRRELPNARRHVQHCRWQCCGRCSRRLSRRPCHQLGSSSLSRPCHPRPPRDVRAMRRQATRGAESAPARRPPAVITVRRAAGASP